MIVEKSGTLPGFPMALMWSSPRRPPLALSRARRPPPCRDLCRGHHRHRLIVPVSVIPSSRRTVEGWAFSLPGSNGRLVRWLCDRNPIDTFQPAPNRIGLAITETKVGRSEPLAHSVSPTAQRWKTLYVAAQSRGFVPSPRCLQRRCRPPEPPQGLCKLPRSPGDLC